MKFDEWLQHASRLLTNAGVPTARLDCLVLVEDSTSKDRAWLLAHPEFEITKDQIHNLDERVKRRAEHEPLAYIRDKTEFYGREFAVNAHTLEPRPETETMIDLLKSLKPDGPIIDVGTGSGCLAITAKLEFPDAKVYGTDIDEKCVVTAQKNANQLGAKVTFLQGDLLEPIPPTNYHLPTTILTNLPYVPDNHTINQAAMFEPKHAIFGGSDGLDLYRRFFLQIAKLSQKPKCVLTESLPFQHTELAKISKISGFTLQKTSDFIQVFLLNKSKG